MSKGIDQIIGEPIDGIEEYDNPMPRWWLKLFYFTIAFAVVYVILYPSLWCWNGITGWSSAAQYEQQMAAAKKLYKRAVQEEAIDLAKAAEDPEVVAAGKEIFKLRCVPCHGPDAKGKIGPDLTDSEWKYGGTSADIVKTISDGRPGGMPTWKKILGKDGIRKVGAYVWSLSH